MMGIPLRSGNLRIPNDTLKLMLSTFGGVIFGFFFGIIFPRLAAKMNLHPGLFPSINITSIGDRYPNLSTRAIINAFNTFEDNNVASPVPSDNSSRPRLRKKMWTPTNPRGAESLPPGILSSVSDVYLRSLTGDPSEDPRIKPKYLVAFTVGYKQKDNIDAAVQKFSENFTIVLFHYDGLTSEWDELEWSDRAIHVSAQTQSKWWFAKRFLHPDIVEPYDYVFIWDEDLGLENFDAEEYIKVVRKHGLEISQPGLDPDSSFLTWAMTVKRNNTEVHKETEERTGWCHDAHSPPCAAFVEIMATVFSRDAWRCVWHMIQNDLVHGWGLDFNLRKCVEPAHEKIGVVDAQWVEHLGIPSLDQGQPDNDSAPRVRERCRKEWSMFEERMTNAENAYYVAMGLIPPNDTSNFRR